MQSRVPFGVFLAPGALVTFFYLREMLALYGRASLAMARWLFG